MTVLRPPRPPASEDELLERARRLTGLRVGEVARALGVELPGEARRAKGRVGALLERALGATAGNRDEPDFCELGVELKTIPLDRAGRVRESTYVCYLDLAAAEREEWPTSRVRRKLQRVLWVPVEWAPGAPPARRHLGTPCLWSPDAAQEQMLRADWTELMGRIAVGEIDAVSAHLGRALQIRPKAASSAVRAWAPGVDGAELAAVPRGFYLRAGFTEAILWQ